MNSNSLYKRVVEATAVYIGPSADRFISKCIVGHLGKAPERLKNADLDKIIKWIKPAIALLTDDERTVDSYIEDIKALAEPARKARNS